MEQPDKREIMEEADEEHKAWIRDNAEPSSAIVYCDGKGDATVLSWTGDQLTEEICVGADWRSETFIEDIPKTRGVSVWEGYVWLDGPGPVCGETDVHFQGTWRTPTLEELFGLRATVPDEHTIEWSDTGEPPEFLLERGEILISHIREMRRDDQDLYNEAISMFAASIRCLLGADTTTKRQMPVSFVALYEELAAWVDETLVPDDESEGKG